MSIELKQGNFYRRKNGNIFRVVANSNLDGDVKVRCIRHADNGEPYTWQSYMKRVQPSGKFTKVGTEEILGLLSISRRRQQ